MPTASTIAFGDKRGLLEQAVTSIASGINNQPCLARRFPPPVPILYAAPVPTTRRGPSESTTDLNRGVIMTDPIDHAARLDAEVSLNSQSIDTVLAVLKDFVGKDAELAAALAERDALNRGVDAAVAELAARREAIAAAVAAIGAPPGRAVTSEPAAAPAADSAIAPAMDSAIAPATDAAIALAASTPVLTGSIAA